MTEHFIQVCKHDRVVNQCRCPGPKRRTVVPCGPACSRPPSKETLSKFGARVAEILQNNNWRPSEVEEAARIHNLISRP